MKNIAVFYGGESVEHDVSVITGVLTLNSVDKEKFNPVPIYIDTDGSWYSGDILFDLDNYANLNKKKLYKVALNNSNVLYKIKGKKFISLLSIGCAVNCMHGGKGENGGLAGLMEFCGIPFASPNVVSSSISMDKCITKYVLKGLNINVLPSVTVTDGFDVKSVKKLGLPLIVKPACLGSSIGITRVNCYENLENAVQNALRYDNKVLVEKCLNDFTEINCSAYKKCNGDIVVSECEKPILKGEMLSFSDKYVNGVREFPANIEPSSANKIKSITKKVYKNLDFFGVIRIDYLIDGNGKIYLNEINSVPGSLAYYFYSDTFKEFSVLLTDVIEGAVKEFSIKNTFIKKYSSHILNVKGCKSSKRIR